MAKLSDSGPDTLVDPFLKEALQNPRHRLTILRMELDIQSFMQNHDQQLFEFPHFPTSYLRLAAHRVAQHYGLQSMVVDNVVDGLRTRIVLKKTAETRQPAICLSEVPPEQLENDKPEHVKIAIRKRSQNAALNGANEAGAKHSTLKTMEERKEEYDRARARIFNNSSSPNPEDVSVQEGSVEEKSFCSGIDASKGYTNFITEREGSPVSSDGSNSRVAIFRDLEKDRSDPDYDRSYERYVRSPPPNQNFSSGAYNLQSFQPTFVKYEAGFPQHGVMPRTQAPLHYRPLAPIMSPFCAVGHSPYAQCPNLALTYTHPYEQVRHAVFQPLADAEGAKKQHMLELLKSHGGLSYPLADAEGAKNQHMIELLKSHGGLSYVHTELYLRSLKNSLKVSIIMEVPPVAFLPNFIVQQKALYPF